MSDPDQIRRERVNESRENETSGDTGDAVDGRDEPVHVESAAHFNDLLAQNGTVLADFYADWCGPCQMLEPIVADLAAETDATVAKVDVDQLQRLAQQYRVQGVPTIHLFVDGEPVEQLVGVRQKDELRSLIEQHA